MTKGKIRQRQKVGILKKVSLIALSIDMCLLKSKGNGPRRNICQRGFRMIKYKQDIMWWVYKHTGNNEDYEVNNLKASLKSVICNVLESIIGDHYGGLYQ